MPTIPGTPESRVLSFSRRVVSATNDVPAAAESIRQFAPTPAGEAVSLSSAASETLFISYSLYSDVCCVHNIFICDSY